MKQEETFEQCRFIFMAQFFTLCHDYNSPEHEVLEEKISRIMKKAESNSHDLIYIPWHPGLGKGAGSYKEFGGINRLSEKLRLHLPRISFVFNIFPHLRLNWTSHPRRHYKKYTRLLEKFITPKEKEIIIRENLRTDEECGHNGPEWDCYAEVFWQLILEERAYVPVLSEIRFWRKGK